MNNKFKDEIIQLSHGDGGLKTNHLINDLILNYLGNDTLNRMEDSAVVRAGNSKIAFTTDSFVVNPIFFPGGDIGKLSICGTVNDLATSGCTPLGLSFSLIMEEGLSTAHLKKILASIKATCREAKVNIVTGDTKVVEAGSVDKIFINTAGIGLINHDLELRPQNIKAGDKIIINGPIGEHGISILSQREQFDFKSKIISDCAPLNLMVDQIIKSSNKIHALRDATRGGLATVLLEMAQASNHTINIYSKDILVTDEVRGVCDFLGLDPLYIANEGKMVIFVAPEDAALVLSTLKKNKYANNASIIGEVGKPGDNPVILNTEIGTRRMLDMQYGEQLPRIC